MYLTPFKKTKEEEEKKREKKEREREKEIKKRRYSSYSRMDSMGFSGGEGGGVGRREGAILMEVWVSPSIPLLVPSALVQFLKNLSFFQNANNKLVYFLFLFI